ncbi:uncharacterized protein F4822DRAFT_44982 [Hypoxylon trugodes]|uniref:uncharacterized protein n=1 Tax=Hypoxylon trugodes TaxID=326681 RepID=UPI0021917A71|nr:uncharacterized protein F4822DRAFT_44982 [Hypoxylon trugodes]KAI1394312.1 hypothetical protein F4822DRAFT_44982 [Hypoxylon trugodes]
MSGGAVGFAFQAEVTNTGSLVHLLTGRALKALSDGGVDFYSVVAAVTLGKSFSVRSALGNTVRSHIMSRGGIQSVLSKALSIGWGHSGLAVEMTHTKAGTNALLLIGALAAGTTYYQAAECFSALLELRGCEADQLPNTDVLKHMISYLAPFVRDLGFSKVLEHITTTGICAVHSMEGGKKTQIINSIEYRGDTSRVAGAINQLMLTSQRGESIYMVTRVRGAWLPAFAAHILGMSVELRLNDTVIWAAAGSNGEVIFELGEHQANQHSVQAISGQKIMLVDTPNAETKPSLSIDYHIGNVFSALLSRGLSIDDELKEGMAQAICYTSLSMLFRRYKSPHCRQWATSAFKETISAFGFESGLIDSIDLRRCARPSWGLLSLSVDAQRKFLRACETHKNEPNYYDVNLISSACTCAHIERHISGFSISAIILSLCRFDATQLRVNGDVILHKFGSDPRYFEPYKDKEKPVPIRTMMAHIIRLTGAEDIGWLDTRLESLNPDHYILGLSSGTQTICYTCVLDNDCYDVQGRLLSLLPGRVSVNGTLRSLLCEERICDEVLVPSPSESAKLASGLYIEPHYLPSKLNMETCMDVSLNEDMVLLRMSIGPVGSPAKHIRFQDCLAAFPINNSTDCSHDTTTGFRVREGQNITVVGFDHMYRSTVRYGDCLQVVALHGNKLEQLITLGILKTHGREQISEDEHMLPSFKFPKRCVLQSWACLDCCIADAERSGHKYVVMGG